MIRAIFIVLALYILGEILAGAAGLAIPGATLGLIFLYCVFAVRGDIDSGLALVFDAVSPHFPLFFIPAAVGIVASLDLLAQNWFYVVSAIFLGTAATLVATGWLAQALLSYFDASRKRASNEVRFV